MVLCRRDSLVTEAPWLNEEKLQAPHLVVTSEAVENSNAFERTGEPLGSQNPPEVHCRLRMLNDFER